MKEYQVFIPYGEERIAAAVTVPDEAVRGLVVLSTGLGATRSHRHHPPCRRRGWCTIGHRPAVPDPIVLLG